MSGFDLSPGEPHLKEIYEGTSQGPRIVVASDVLED